MTDASDSRYNSNYAIFEVQYTVLSGSWKRHGMKLEIAPNCEKYIRAKDTQVSLTIFPSECKCFKPFVLLSFIFESTDRYKGFHERHPWQLNLSWSYHQKWNHDKIKFYFIPHVPEIAREMGHRSLRQPKSEESRPIMENKMCKIL